MPIFDSILGEWKNERDDDIDPDTGVIDEWWTDDYHPFMKRPFSYAHWIVFCCPDGRVITLAVAE